LTIASPGGQKQFTKMELGKLAETLDFINVMTYDYHGGWAPTGPTNFHSHLFADPADPSSGIEREYVTDKSIQYLISQGIPRSKLLVGVGFYGRGWTGVAPGPGNNGLYQSATGPAPGTYDPGVEDYRVLVNKSGTRFYHPVTKQLYLYTGANGQWWSYDDATSIASKMQYVRDQSLRGAFSWSLDGDTSNGALATEVWKVR